MSVDAQKRAAADYAASLVEHDSIVGLGSGSTAEIAVHALGRRYQEGLRFVGVATSRQTEQIARSYGIPISHLDEQLHLDLTIDGADEVDTWLNLVKGRGGALLREKLVATAARRFIVVVDETKLVERLGDRAPIPVEVVPFGWTTTRHRLQALGFAGILRRDAEHVYRTSNHNYILDCHSSGLDLADPRTGVTIKTQTGVVEHGLFVGLASMIVVGRQSGEVEVRQAG
jgi:ribose 5-phosphate isomerase A